MTRPRRLEPGDGVALIAPASAFKREDFDATVAELVRLGYQPVYDESVFARDQFTAGSPKTRAKAMHDAWQNASVTALLAMRGGYGSAQLLPLLDAALLADARKLLIGYSDVTALLCLHLMRGVVAIHGPMGEGRLARGRDGYDEASFRAVVTRAEPAGALAPSGVAALHRGEARGPLVGGTLTQLVSLLGTPWAFEVPRGAILFLEDVAERPYRIHRMLTQLAQAGALARAAGIVFGEFPRCDEPGGSPAIRDVLAEFTSGFPGPVLFGFPSGHTTGPMWTLPLGVRAWLRTAPQPGLIIEEAAVD